MRGILGQKVGMTAVFDKFGAQIPVTVIRTTGNRVLAKRTESVDGYDAIVLGFGERRLSRTTRPEAGFFEKHDLIEERDGQKYVKRHVREFRVSADDLEGFEIGTTITAADEFFDGAPVDVVGTSKGRGFSGVMKRHNFRGGKATHGVHEYYRHGGSIGSNTDPARCFKNRKMPGQHGNRRVTIQNLEIVEIMADEGLVLIRGGIPGPNGGLVHIQHAVKARR